MEEGGGAEMRLHQENLNFAVSCHPFLFCSSRGPSTHEFIVNSNQGKQTEYMDGQQGKP